MARLRPLTDEEIDPQFRPLLGRGDEPSVRILAHVPEQFRRFTEFHRFNLTDGLLPARLKELVRLKIAAVNRCAL